MRVKIDNDQVRNDRIQKVEPEDIRRVVNKYFTEENSNVGIYYTKEDEAGDKGGSE